MLRQVFKCITQGQKNRSFSTSQLLLHRVAVIGAAGSVGKVLCMLLKMNPYVTDLVLHDIQSVDGMAADLAHIDTYSGVEPRSGAKQVEQALRCSELVVVVAGIPVSEKVSRKAMFDANKAMIYDLARLKGKNCPEAFMVIITNPVNAMVPLAAEALKHEKAYNPKKLFGFSRVDTVRARTFIAELLVVNPVKVSANVIGGHSVNTIVPVIAKSHAKLPDDEDILLPIYQRVKNGSDDILKAKMGKATAQLCVSYAAAQFCHSLLEALHGKSGVFDVAYVESKLVPGLSFFSSRVDLSVEGIKEYHPLPDMTVHERDLLKKAIPELKESIEIAKKYAESRKNEKKGK